MPMLQFNNLSIRFKLVVLLGASAAIALLISSILTLYSIYASEKEEALRTLRQLGGVSSENLRAALAFRDAGSAKRILSPLHANPQIVAAFIEDEDGQAFSCYFAPGLSEETCEQTRKATRETLGAIQKRDNGVEISTFRHLYVMQPIMFEGTPIGTLSIVSDTSAIRVKLTRYIKSQLMISVGTLVILILISIPLEELFTRPIFTLLTAMREVSRTKNYAVNVQLTRQDEFMDLCQGFNTMLAEIRERDEKLSTLATTDALTGLANRRHALEKMEEMLARARRKHEPLGVIMLDVDFFKHINDKLGHPVGDTVLREIARALSGSSREYDLVARVGGEEFLILCDNADQETTRAVAERIRARFEDSVIDYGDAQQVRVTVSLGVCSEVPYELTVEQLLKAADDALYQAKESGRNRVEMGRVL